LDVRQLCIGSILLLTAVSSSAVTLGRHSGAGVIGRPLDIRVQALLSPGEDIANLCINADVLYGDVKISPGAIRTTPQRSSPDAEASVRIQALIPIDEPIVTVFVRAGCTTPFTRRYVLLADPVSEPTRPPARASVEPSGLTAPSASELPSVPAVTGTPLPAAAGSERAAETGQAVRAPAAPARAVREPARAAERPARPSSVVRRPVAPPVASTPRLELEAVDLSLAIERDPVLKLSLSLLSEPTTSEETRAAAGLLWKAINASPEDILRDAQKLEVLEAESKGLREAEARSQATIADLSSAVEQSRTWQWLVYLLGALLALALLGLLWLWRRQKSARDFDAAKAWWAAEGAAKGGLRDPTLTRAAAAAEAAPVDIDLDLSDSSSAGDLRALSGAHPLDVDSTPHELDSSLGRSSKAGSERRDFAPSQMASRSVAAEELFDVQQQADFFTSLGEDEQAIQVLRNHIQESQVPSALAYLDLFKIYHRLGRTADYEALRTEFNRVFNAGAPPFDQYADSSQGLEAYETAFGRIQALWPEPRVLDVIEESIFREPGDLEAEVFDLEAYRELLLLHALAKELIQREATDPVAPADFQNTKVQRLQAKAKAVAGAAATGAATKPMDMHPPASPNLGLDVNLDDLSEFSAFEASLPEVPAPVTPTAKPRSQRDSDDRDEAGNLIDFEVLDFTAPDDDEGKEKGKGDDPKP
jgi:hypothetical protein